MLPGTFRVVFFLLLSGNIESSIFQKTIADLQAY